MLNLTAKVLCFLQIGFMTYIVFDVSRYDVERIALYTLLFAAPIVSILALSAANKKDDEDSLLSLWIQVRKKKLQYELEK